MKRILYSTCRRLAAALRHILSRVETNKLSRTSRVTRRRRARRSTRLEPPRPLYRQTLLAAHPSVFVRPPFVSVAFLPIVLSRRRSPVYASRPPQSGRKPRFAYRVCRRGIIKKKKNSLTECVRARVVSAIVSLNYGNHGH